MKCIILSGVPGSGKSTYATNNLVTADADVHSADSYFINPYTGEYKFDASKLPEAHASCMRGFVGSILDKVPLVIVDNTNTTAVEIAPYYAVASAYGYQVEIVTIMVNPADLPKCFARNTHNVPEASIRRMAANIANRQMPRHWVSRTIPATF